MIFFFCVCLLCASLLDSGVLAYSLATCQPQRGGLRLWASGSEHNFMSIRDIEEYARISGLKLKASETGPALRLEAAPLSDPDSPIGYLTAFIRPLPLKLFHLDTIQVKNRRQNLGFERKGYTIEGPGISFIMGSYALVWARERGCTTTQLLAVKDSDDMHKVLLRMYKGYGFKVLREVGDDTTSIM